MYVDSFRNISIGTELSRKEIISILQKKYDIDDTSILPSDLCYNSSNIGIEGNGKVRLFLKTGRGMYKYVGPNYDTKNIDPYEYGSFTGALNTKLDDKKNENIASQLPIKEGVRVDVKQLRSIKADDNISFQYNYEALNACFGANVKETIQQAIWRNSNDGCVVWFPHLAKLVNGRYVAGSQTTNWKNYFEDNGNVIIQMLYKDEKVDSNDKDPIFRPDINPMHTFMKMGDKDYRYVGTYMLDRNSSSPRYQVVRRLKANIDLSVWASGYDMDYFDTSEIGKDVFKDYYLGRSFKKQKEYISQFNRNISVLNQEEQHFDTVKESFVDSYSIAALNRMSAEVYTDEYIPRLIETINGLFNSHYDTETLLKTLGSLPEFGAELRELIFDKEMSENDKIRKCRWGSVLTAQIYTLYYEAKEYDFSLNVYTLDEHDTEQVLFALGITADKDDDLVEKQSKICFWRYCDDVLRDMSSYRFYQFICFMADTKKKSIKYVQSVKPDAANRIRKEALLQEEELENKDLSDAPKTYEYDSKPRIREINTNIKASQGCVVPRHQDRKINALVRAHYCCEIDKNHPTFKRRNSDKNYTETHHLIPLEYSSQFQFTLDTEENIVSLCSNCHNQIHYGAGADVLLKRLFEERKEALKAAGLDKTEDGIEVDIIQLLHMYGLN